jgi:hypothetical protein
MGAFRSVWYRLVLLLFAAFLARLWFVYGPSNPWYALAVAWATCSLEPALAAPFLRRAPRRWSRVPESERVLHRMVGVRIFGWLLDASGWNRLITPMRGFSGKKANLLWLEQHARAGAIAHGICFAIHILLALLALLTQRPWSGALWMLWPGVVVHLYPVALQRSMMLRLQPLLDKAAPVGWVGR